MPTLDVLLHDWAKARRFRQSTTITRQSESRSASAPRAAQSRCSRKRDLRCAVIDLLASGEVRLAIAAWVLCSPAIALLAAQFLKGSLR